MSGKVKCTCGWSWNKSDSSVKDMYICHECGRDNSNNMKNGGWLDNIDKAQTGKKVEQETEVDRAKRVARKVASTSGVGLALDQFPGAETAYDLYNIVDAYKQGDPMKIIPNVMGALLPGLSGKSFEAISDEYLPKTPRKVKEKIKAVLKGKRASVEEIKKAQESVDWSTGFKKLYDDVGEIGTGIKNTIDDTVTPLMGLKNGGWLDNYNDSSVSLPEGYVGEGIFNGPIFENPAVKGQFQMGGVMPGAVGHMYARTGDIRSKGPRRNQTDVTDASAQNGKEMQYYQQGLDWKPKSISRDGSVIKDDRGQWDHPGEITEINSNDITMEGVPYDVLGISDTGDTKLMKPGKNYKFKGKKVTEYPMAKNGVNQQDQKTLQQLDQLTNFTNYNTKQPGGWLDTL
jgi:hypothetical protein